MKAYRLAEIALSPRLRLHDHPSHRPRHRPHLRLGSRHQSIPQLGPHHEADPQRDPSVTWACTTNRPSGARSTAMLQVFSDHPSCVARYRAQVRGGTVLRAWISSGGTPRFRDEDSPSRRAAVISTCSLEGWAMPRTWAFWSPARSVCSASRCAGGHGRSGPEPKRKSVVTRDRSEILRI